LSLKVSDATKRSLKDRTAVITGASRGLGRSIALALGEAGANLSLVSRDEKRLLEVAEEARQLSAEAEAFIVDVTDERQVMNLSRAVISRFGKLEILVNNAGIAIRKTVTDFTLGE
jgi:NAD(P)-dependent dehydrogenase (short-subunit alcohol dehydrogenase family)